MKDPLFEPIRIGAMEMKNRIAMPAMHMNMAQDYLVTDRLVDFYAERARGGAGLIIVGYATVDEHSGFGLNIGAHDDKFLPSLERLARAVREGGALSAVQLNHAGRYNFSFLMEGREPVAPSPVASRLTRETPRELGLEEIPEIVGSFARAAGRVKKAGFDAVEVLSGTGYLISSFLSPLTNKRTDRYGGSFDNRIRFGLEIARAVREEVGRDFPLIFRLNGNEFMAGGLGRRELLEYARRLAAEGGVDALNVNVGWHEAKVPQITSEVPRGVFAYMARGIREATGVPVMASHRINRPELARTLVADGFCDIAAMGRALIADPFLPEKARTGREAEVVHCIACGQGCFDHIFELKPVECLCNPRASHEKELRAVRASSPKNVMVVGGGASGMSAAVAAAERGHRVTLYEEGQRLGGQLLLAGAPPGREEFLGLVDDLSAQLAALGVSVVLNARADVALVEKERPDVVVLATGALPAAPALPGGDLPHVVQAWDVLAGRAWTGKRVVVIGGGAVGLETALLLGRKGTLSGEALRFLFVNRAEDPADLYDLAVRGSKQVTVVELLDKAGKDIGKTTRWGMFLELERLGVVVRTEAQVLEVTPAVVRVRSGDRVEEVPADTVVFATGALSNAPLKELLEKKGARVLVVGDAAQVANAFEAVHRGFRMGAGIA